MNDGTAASGRLQGQADWMGRLLAAFGGDPSGWEWTGEVREQDPAAMGGVHCACGQHGLRYLFPWRKAGIAAEVITGSVCVNQVPGLSADQLQRLQAEVERRLAAEREAKTAKRRASKVEEVRVVADEIRAQLQRVIALDARYHRREKLEPEQWNLAQAYHGYSADLAAGLRLKSPHGKLQRLIRLRDRLAKRLAAADAVDARAAAPAA
jgi:hypothetical protein